MADSSLASRAVSDSWLATDVLRGRVVSALLRPLSVAALRLRALATLLLALERRRIAHPKAGTTPMFKVRLQQGFATGEMGFRISLRGSNP
jgi:hypothetical protein